MIILNWNLNNWHDQMMGARRRMFKVSGVDPTQYGARNKVYDQMFERGTTILQVKDSIDTGTRVYGHQQASQKAAERQGTGMLNKSGINITKQQGKNNTSILKVADNNKHSIVVGVHGQLEESVMRRITEILRRELASGKDTAGAIDAVKVILQQLGANGKGIQVNGK